MPKRASIIIFPLSNNIAAYRCPYEYYSRTGILCLIKQNLVLKILSDMIQNIVPTAEELAAEFYDNYGTDGIVERICSVIQKRAHKIG
jgi:hypothetical protein